MVIGDDMAEWLSSGLEEAFSESPQLSVRRRTALDSGLVRYSAQNESAWPQIARDILSRNKADYSVVMLGLSDRQDIQEKAAKEDAQNIPVGETAKTDELKNSKTASVLKETSSVRKQTLTFRSEEWTKAYIKRIDDFGLALKSKGAPVFWVGLPPVRSSRTTSDLAFLNDLYRSGAERAGIIYIDVWDGFIDEAGRYSAEGPDFEGQKRRLRSSDGVFFTKAGARKLAHYVERELRRYMSASTTVNLPPKNPIGAIPNEQSVERPLSGPVLPLTATVANSDELLGAAGSTHGDGNSLSEKVLKKGEAVAAPLGRADNFSWPDNAPVAKQDLATRRVSKSQKNLQN